MNPNEPVPAAPGAEPQTYTVAEGDTLAWLADRWGVEVDDIAAANRIVEPDLIYPGQVLVLPDPARPTTTEETDHGNL